MADRPLGRLAARFAMGAAVGGVAGYLAATLGVLEAVEPAEWRADDAAALLLAAVLLVMGAYAALAGAGPGIYRRIAERNAEAGEPVDPDAVPNARRQAVVLIAAGLALAAPPLAMMADAGLSLRHAAMAAILVLLAIESRYNWALWRRGDELTRRVIVESAAVTFWAGQLALFVFAALARMALVPELSSWALLQCLLAVYLVGSAIIGVRRGIAEP